MENNQMNRPGCRPYNRTCGMMNPPASFGAERDGRRQAGRMQTKERECSCHMPGTRSRDREMYEHLQHLEYAMAYVPCQEFTTTFELGRALRVGTIFPQLCRPFCGKRGGCR